MTSPIIDLAAASAGGFVLESSAVFWVHFSERNDRRRLTCVSALQATALALGITEAAHGWVSGAAFVVGYALGANVAVWFKVRQASDG